MRALLASPLGFLIGISLGALGGGGSILQHSAARRIDRVGNRHPVHDRQPAWRHRRQPSGRHPRLVVLQRWFVVLLVVVATYTAVQSGLALR